MFDTFIEFCGYVSIIGGALVLLYSLYRFIVGPHEKVNEKLKNDYEDIKELEDNFNDLKKEIDDLKQGLGLCLQAVNQLLEHTKTGNNTGGMQKSQDDIFDFLNYK